MIFFWFMLMIVGVVLGPPFDFIAIIGWCGILYVGIMAIITLVKDPKV